MTTWVDIEGVTLNEIHQRMINMVLLHLYMACKQNKTSEQTDQNINRLIDTEKKLRIARKERGEGWLNR